MATSLKKVDIQISAEVYKAAKQKAAHDGKSISEWVASLVTTAIYQEDQHTISAMDWGRIDSRIDERTALLELQIEKLAKQVEHLSTELRLQKAPSDRPVLSSSSIR